jgi:hypothetical protein
LELKKYINDVQFTKKKRPSMLENFFVPLFNVVGSILLQHVRRFILLRHINKQMVPLGNCITVELITAIWIGKSWVAEKTVV